MSQRANSGALLLHRGGRRRLAGLAAQLIDDLKEYRSRRDHASDPVLNELIALTMRRYRLGMMSLSGACCLRAYGSLAGLVVVSPWNAAAMPPIAATALSGPD